MKKKMSIVINNRQIKNQQEYLQYCEDIKQQEIENKRRSEEQRKKNIEISKQQEEKRKQAEELKKELEHQKELERLKKIQQKKEKDTLKKEQIEKEVQEDKEKLASCDKIMLVEDIGLYKVCEICGNEYEKKKWHVYSSKTKNSIRYCSNCSRVLVQFNHDKILPKTIAERVTMSSRLENMYSRVVLKNQIKKNRDYLIDNSSVNLHLNFSGSFCYNCGQYNSSPIMLNFNVYDVVEQKFTVYKKEVFVCTGCGRFQMERIRYCLHDCKRYIFFHNIFDDDGKRIAIPDAEGFKERMQNGEEVVAFSLEDSSKSLIRIHGEFCVIGGHELQEIEGIINVINSSGEILEVKVPIAKCIVCNKYYLHDRQYKKLKALGMILCRIEDKKAQYDVWGNHFSEWNQESILHMYGYNVSSTVNLTETQRHTVLKMLVERKILSRFSIIDHLEFLINLNRDKIGFDAAVKKWEIDVDFLQTISVNATSEEIEELKVVKHLNWVHK